MSKLNKAENWIDENLGWVVARILFITIILVMIYPFIAPLVIAYIALVLGIGVWAFINNK